MKPFRYLQPATLALATQAMANDPDAKLLAGGMTLIPVLKLRLAQPSLLVDVARLPELLRLEPQGDHLWVGAALCHAQVAASSLVQQTLPGLAALAQGIGDPQVRARGTLGGSVANNDPAADYPAALLALGATVVTQQRELAAEDFFLGTFTTALADDEIITGVRFPRPVRSAYAKCRHPATGYAMPGVFVADFGSAGRRVAVTGAVGAVCRWPQAETQAAWAPGTAAPVLARSDVLDDIHAPADYRAHMAGLMFKRALNALA